MQEALRGPGGHPSRRLRAAEGALDFNAPTARVYLAQTAARDLEVPVTATPAPTFVDIDGSLVLAGIASWGDIPLRDAGRLSNRHPVGQGLPLRLRQPALAGSSST
jgi:hypothetical protein